MLKACLNILEKPELLRTNDDIEQIAKGLVDLKIFDQLRLGNREPTEFAQKLVGFMKCEVAKKGTSLIAYGQPCERVCFIVRGKAQEYVLKNEDELEMEKVEATSFAICELEDNLAISNTRKGFTKESLESISEVNEPDPSPFFRKSKFPSSVKKELFTSNGNPQCLNQLDVDDHRYKINDSFQISDCDSNASNASLDSIEEKGFENGSLGESKALRDMKTFRILGPGYYFGINSLNEECFSQSTILAAEDCHCIVFYRKDYFATLNMYDKILFFKGIFPFVAKDKIENFCSLWSEEIFKHRDTIFKENDLATSIFALFKGEMCMGSSNSSLQVASLKEGDFFGEELIEKKARNTAARVNSSEARVFRLSLQDYRLQAEEHLEIFAKIKEMSRRNIGILRSLSEKTLMDSDRKPAKEEILDKKEAGRPESKEIRNVPTMVIRSVKTIKKGDVMLRDGYNKNLEGTLLKCEENSRSSHKKTWSLVLDPKRTFTPNVKKEEGSEMSSFSGPSSENSISFGHTQSKQRRLSSSRGVIVTQPQPDYNKTSVNFTASSATSIMGSSNGSIQNLQENSMRPRTTLNKELDTNYSPQSQSAKKGFFAMPYHPPKLKTKPYLVMSPKYKNLGGKNTLRMLGGLASRNENAVKRGVNEIKNHEYDTNRPNSHINLKYKSGNKTKSSLVVRSLNDSSSSFGNRTWSQPKLEDSRGLPFIKNVIKKIN